MPFCSKCGTQNQDTANVCSSCGNNLNLSSPKPDSGSDGFLGGIKGHINDLIQFFDSGEFFKISWKGMNYYLLMIVYILIPAGLIAGAVNNNIFDMPAKFVIVLFVALVFLCFASFLSILVIQNKVKDFDEKTKEFSVSKVTLSNFYDFFKVACVHSIETNIYAFGIFIAISVFGLAVCGLFVSEIRDFLGTSVLMGFIIGPAYGYLNIFITKVIVLFLKVFLDYLPKLFIIPIRALYNLFGIIIDTRHNLWK